MTSTKEGRSKMDRKESSSSSSVSSPPNDRAIETFCEGLRPRVGFQIRLLPLGGTNGRQSEGSTSSLRLTLFQESAGRPVEQFRFLTAVAQPWAGDQPVGSLVTTVTSAPVSTRNFTFIPLTKIGASIMTMPPKRNVNSNSRAKATSVNTCSLKHLNSFGQKFPLNEKLCEKLSFTTDCWAGPMDNFQCSSHLLNFVLKDGWWDNDKDKEWNKLMLEHNFHHQIDRQNTQLGQIEPNSTDQNPSLTESDQLGQIEPKSTDQNPPLTESDHSDNAKNGEEQNENIAEDERKHKTVAKEMGLSDRTIYRWRRELGQTTPNKHSLIEQKELMKRYYEIKDKTPKISVGGIAKMLNIGRATLYRWIKQFKRQQFHPNSVDGLSVEENAAAHVHLLASVSIVTAFWIGHCRAEVQNLENHVLQYILLQLFTIFSSFF
uniref:Uncharacterized protein n=1 Tax=Globodera rostochiensis TaxID=31243 RepID=A0A914HQ90_GLORO